jgi:hypothetical protein
MSHTVRRKALFATLALLLGVVTGCSTREVDPYEAAVVVPIAAADRDELAALIAGFAHRNGFYLRDSSNYMKDTTGTATFYVVVYRGLGGGDEWAEIQAHATADEYPIITFNRPSTDAATAAEGSWNTLVAEVKEQWPRTGSVPILPHGGVPHATDLVETKDGFKIHSAQSGAYEVPAGSPLLAN